MRPHKVGRVPFFIEPFIQDPDSALLKKAILEDKPHFPKRLTRECRSFLYSVRHLVFLKFSCRCYCLHSFATDIFSFG